MLDEVWNSEKSFPEQSEYVKTVRQAAMHLSVLLPTTDGPAYRAARNMLSMTMPREFNVSDETCRQAGLKFVADAILKDSDPFSKDALTEFRDIVSFGVYSNNRGQFSDEIWLRQRQLRRS